MRRLCGKDAALTGLLIALLALGVATASAGAAMREGPANGTKAIIFYAGVKNAGLNEGRSALAFTMAAEKNSAGLPVWTGTPGACDSSHARPNPGRPISQLVGYSLGRLGPAYYLQQEEQHGVRSAVRTVVLIDPGDADDFTDSKGKPGCDSRSGAARTFATWLRQNSANRLIILAGARTQEKNSAALQSVYLSQLRAATAGAYVASRVLVCNAPFAHDQMPGKFSSVISSPAAFACPSGSSGSPLSPNAPPLQAPGAAPGPVASPAPVGTTPPPAETPAQVPPTGGGSGAPSLAAGTYRVANADGGIFWRSGPDWSTAVATPGVGFYPDTVIRPLCWQGGARNAPGSTNSIWELAQWVSGSGGGSGWINEHFIADGVGLDEHTPGVPACATAPPPATTSTQPTVTQPTTTQPTVTQPIVAPPTWAETAGGEAHTWTNPANAGGTQGPTIAGGQTVAIACKLSGFRVADGNTWWYRIAQSPWNGQYYVSADAFYNNGQTSGSLHGTAFVDPAVASC